jgi:hypothetical protein
MCIIRGDIRRTNNKIEVLNTAQGIDVYALLFSLIMGGTLRLSEPQFKKS